MHTAVRWEQQGPKSWVARDHGTSLGLVLHVRERFLAFDQDDRPLGSAASLAAAQQLVAGAVRSSAPARRDTVAVVLSVLAALTVGGAAVVLAARALI
ncbi:hypothetical protein DEJ03_05245 [Curtobacterium sp. MCLR17_043]|uniref:hypothetical protein n=1 Tax=Curtobacterium sp. MCLR17_043 TaxID=2175627 RepID=UPI000D813E78|nr:hypothetical protein [Curtobacterium sp. MCLR17_043]PYY47264.1 hypothetical protein DEJ03_05245 [Curtobacterium sp. MCLR17_043]